MNIKKKLEIFFLFILFILVIFFFYSRSKHIFIGPKLISLSPENNSSLSESYILLKGKTKNVSEIILNDRTLFITKKGDFTENIILNFGLNILKLELKDRFGKLNTKYLKYYLKEELISKMEI